MKTQKVRKQENTGYRKRSKKEEMFNVQSVETENTGYRKRSKEEEEEEMFNVESVETGKYRLQEEK